MIKKTMLIVLCIFFYFHVEENQTLNIRRKKIISLLLKFNEIFK